MENLRKPQSDVEVTVVDDNGGQRKVSSSSCSSISLSSSCSSEERVHGTEIKERRTSSSVSEVVDLECGEGVVGVAESKVHVAKDERDCRICHLSMDAANHESGVPIELGCSCKDDLAAAHKHCAEAWFKIKGNKTCEICGSIAYNVIGANDAELAEQLTESNDTTSAATAEAASAQSADTLHFWQGHRFLNFLLACMVFAFVISWLFHFNVPS